jgi:hypothetical protein
VRRTLNAAGRGRPRWRTRLVSTCAAFVLVASSACGKKGPPLPPLVKLPTAPEEFTAVRRGDTVRLRFVVPNANTDRTRPANVERVEVYALSGPAPTTDAELLKRAAKVATVTVKAPRDPDQTSDIDEPADEAQEIDPPEGPGLDQGAAAQVEEQLPEPLAGPFSPGAADPVASRTYVGVGVNKSGRRGPVSRRAAVPLVPPPPSPDAVSITYDEHAVTVAWRPPQLAREGEQPSLAYHVYEVASAGGQRETEVQLTKTPVTEARFADARISWGSTRCYLVRTVEMFASLAVESGGGERECVTLKDTFPPAAPQGLTAVASEGAISLIWEPNNEPDLRGYLVLRGAAAGRLEPITPEPMTETTFRDEVPRGAHYAYAIKAVDKAGNISAPSASVEETAR